MPTLPMYYPPLEPSGWHRSFAPGASESWKFKAEDESGKVRMFAIFSDGRDCPEYKIQYRDYLKRPTKCAPPLPRDFPYLDFGILPGAPGFIMSSSPYHPGAFQGRANEIRLGENVARWEDGHIKLEIHARDVDMQLVFTEIAPDKRGRTTGVLKVRDNDPMRFDGVGWYSHEYGIINPKQEHGKRITSQRARGEISALFDR